ncbi:MAG: hypothetical protein D4R48_03840, partial [Nitrosomonadales bacterium]
LLSGDKAGALEGLTGSKSKPAAQAEPAAPAPAAPDSAATQTAPAQPAAQEKPKSTPEEKVKKKLNKLLGL